MPEYVYPGMEKLFSLWKGQSSPAGIMAFCQEALLRVTTVFAMVFLDKKGWATHRFW